MDVLFVYYRVAVEHRNRARQCVIDMQRQVAAHCDGVTPRLMYRSNEGASGETWLEIYEPVTAELDVLLDRLVKNCGLLDLIGARTIERFSQT
jgi:hypothetical protein